MKRLELRRIYEEDRTIGRFSYEGKSGAVWSFHGTITSQMLAVFRLVFTIVRSILATSTIGSVYQ